jgi:hypothetical protein
MSYNMPQQGVGYHAYGDITSTNPIKGSLKDAWDCYNVQMSFNKGPISTAQEQAIFNACRKQVAMANYRAPAAAVLYHNWQKRNSPLHGTVLAAFGATFDFNAQSTWADWKSGASGNNAAGARAAKNIQAGLNAIGYGPLTVDGQFGNSSFAAWNRFAREQGATENQITQAGLIKLQELTSAGDPVGGGQVVASHVVGGEFVSGAAPGSGSSKASMGMMLGVGALVLVGVGALALMSKKKTSTSPTAAKPAPKLASVA